MYTLMLTETVASANLAQGEVMQAKPLPSAPSVASAPDKSFASAPGLYRLYLPLIMKAY
jgi:hypothetical protein